MKSKGETNVGGLKWLGRKKGRHERGLNNTEDIRKINEEAYSISRLDLFFSHVLCTGHIP